MAADQKLAEQGESRVAAGPASPATLPARQWSQWLLPSFLTLLQHPAPSPPLPASPPPPPLAGPCALAPPSSHVGRGGR